MSYKFAIGVVAFSLFASVAVAENAAETADTKDAPSTELGTNAAMSTVLREGIDGKGLSMGEKWSDDVVVCKREKLTGSRFARKVCHTRAEWHAMKSNGRETVDYVQRTQVNSGGN